MSDFNTRFIEATRILKQYPDRIPIIVKPNGDLKIDKHKYLVPKVLKLKDFIQIIRQRLTLNSKHKLPPECSLFVFTNNHIIPIQYSLEEIYKQFSDKDCFLYLTISVENTFG